MKAGVDITTDPWRIVMTDKRNTVVGSYRLHLGARSGEEISSDIGAFFSRFGKRIPVSIGIGGRGVTLKHMILPRLEGDDLKGAAAAELSASLTTPIENPLVDCSVMESIEQDGIGKFRVLGVIAERKLVVNAIERLHRAGAEVTSIEPTAFSILRYTDRLDSPALGRFWIHLRADSLSVAATVEGKIVFWREVVRDFSLLPSMGMSAEMAREGMVSEVVQSFDYFATKHHQVEMAQIIFVSSFEDSSALRAAIAQGLGLEIRVEDPFERLEASPNERPQGDAAGNGAWVVAMGLALREAGE